jgi:hypothetical protein
MDRTHIMAGKHQVVASDIEFSTSVDLGDSTIGLRASGSGIGTGTGTIELIANGQVAAQAGEASFQISSGMDGQSSVSLDGGTLGNVQISNGPPVEAAQTIELSTEEDAIQISNGNVPGTMQTIQLSGLSQSIELNAGGLPVSPMISMSPTGIRLSVGPESFIEISAEGITLSGPIISIESLAETSIQGMAVSVEAELEATIEGALVMIQ